MNRNSLITKIKATQAKINTKSTEVQRLTWTLAEQFTALKATYQAGQEKAFLSTAATATGRTEDSVRNLVAAFEIRQGLSAKNAPRVAEWPYDSVLALRPGKNCGNAEQGRIITKAEKAGTTNTKSIRKFRAEVVKPTHRDRQSAAEATTKLAETIRKDVERLFKNGHDPLAIVAGIELANTYSSQYLASAVRFLAVNARMPAKVVK